jgi:hypothetical protein
VVDVARRLNARLWVDGITGRSTAKTAQLHKSSKREVV